METAAQYFGARVDAYDSLIRRCVPRYQEMTSALVCYLPDTATDILELGCGTGNLSLALAARYPDARISFVDASDEMVLLTRERVTAAAPAVAERASFTVARFEDVELKDGDVDLITSSISLHHVIDKAALFARLHGALRAGGRLCYADQMRAEPAANHERNWQDWLAFCRLPGNCTDEEIESLVEHSIAHDHYVTPSVQLHWLERAGFRDLDCLWRNGMWGIITATAR